MLEFKHKYIVCISSVLLIAVQATGCITPPKPSPLMYGLYKLKTLPFRLTHDRTDAGECENCEGCTRCKPCPPDPISQITHRFSPILDRFNSKKNAEECAFCTLKAYQEQTGENLSCEFEDGFVQAYLDIADGYSGETPAVPSPQYWHARYRIPEGQARVQRWFEGYEIGALNAEQDGIGHHQIATPMHEFQQDTPMPQMEQQHN